MFTLVAQARARLNTAYMTCVSLGGSAGSWLDVRAYTTLGWPGIPGLIALAGAVALVRHVFYRAAGEGRI